MAFISDWFSNYRKEVKETNTRRFRNFILSVPFFMTLIGLVLIIAFGITLSIQLSSRTEQKLNRVWAGGETGSYRHMAVYAGGYRPNGSGSPLLYLDAGSSLAASDITSIRTSLQSAVDSGSQTANKNANSDGTPVGWEDCWSTWMSSSVSYNSGNDDSTAGAPIDVDLFAVGGNFRAFHPFEYMSGGFLPEVCVDQEQIVINDILSWKLFKSYDVVGNVLSMFGKNYTIIGVVREGSFKFDQMAGTSKARVYMYFSELQNEVVEGDSEGVQKLAIGCYEAMLPEVVSGVAKTDMTTALPNYNAANPHMYVVSITGRYSLTDIWKFMIPLGESDEKLSDYDFPYWEKAAQLAMKYLFVDGVVIAAGIVLTIAGSATLVLKSRKFRKDA